MTNQETCTTIEEKIMLLVYDELESDEMAEVNAHVDNCPACKETYELLKKSAMMMDESTVNFPPLKLSEEERTNILINILDEDAEADVEGNDESSPTKPPHPTSFVGTPMFWILLVITMAIAAAIILRLRGD